MYNTMNFFKEKDNFEKYRSIKSKHVIKNSMTVKPFISIIIPTYKKVDMLKLALDSALNQKGNHSYEIVVVNDDPEDTELERYLRGLNADNINYYINERNIGLFGNWNRSIELSKGEWVAILNDDDYLYNYYLEDVINIVTHHKNIQYLYLAHDIAKITSPEQAEKIFRNKEKQALSPKKREKKVKCITKEPLLWKVDLLDIFMTQNITHPLGTLIKRKNLLKIGGYNEDYYPSADWILNVNYLLKYNIYYYSGLLGCRSEGINLSTSADTKMKFIEMDYLFRKEFEKQIKLPLNKLKRWYSCCLLNDYARMIHVLNKINITAIKELTKFDIMLYRIIRKYYVKCQNIKNNIKK